MARCLLSNRACAGAHREVFFRIGAVLSVRPPIFSKPSRYPMMFDPVSFALLLTLGVLAVVFVILAAERIWLMRKNSGSSSDDYRMGIIEY